MNSNEEDSEDIEIIGLDSMSFIIDMRAATSLKGSNVLKFSKKSRMEK